MVLTAFKIPGYGEDDIEIVFPKRSINETEVNESFNRWINVNLDNVDISNFNDEEPEKDDEQVCDEGVSRLDCEDIGRSQFSFKKKKDVFTKKGSVINWLNDVAIKRDYKLA